MGYNTTSDVRSWYTVDLNIQRCSYLSLKCSAPGLLSAVSINLCLSLAFTNHTMQLCVSTSSLTVLCSFSCNHLFPVYFHFAGYRNCIFILLLFFFKFPMVPNTICPYCKNSEVISFGQCGIQKTVKHLGSARPRDFRFVDS